MVNPVSASRKRFKETIHTKKKEKTIPNEILGIEAATALEPGMEGILGWLREKRIHKYWPFFSHLRYEELIALREDNVDWFLKELGAKEAFFEGTRKKILRCVDELRSRTRLLRDIDPSNVIESWEVISPILKSPISDRDIEEDGTSLTALLKNKLTEVVDTSRSSGKGVEIVKMLLVEYVDHPSIPEYDKVCVHLWLDYMKNNSFCENKTRAKQVGQKSPAPHQKGRLVDFCK